jgi:uncharacterized membrane protein
VGLILAPKMGSVEGVPLHALAVALLATVSLTLGTIWQKRSKPEMDLRVNAAIQFVGALALTTPFALLLEANRFDASPALFGALAWAVLGLSVGGISILLVLLKRGAASKVAPLLYLSPPIAALLALAIFREPLTAIQLAGMVLAVVGAFRGAEIVTELDGSLTAPAPARRLSGTGVPDEEAVGVWRSSSCCRAAPRRRSPTRRPGSRLFRDALFAAPTERIDAAEIFAVSDEMRHYVRYEIAERDRGEGPPAGPGRRALQHEQAAAAVRRREDAQCHRGLRRPLGQLPLARGDDGDARQGSWASRSATSASLPTMRGAAWATCRSRAAT